MNHLPASPHDIRPCDLRGGRSFLIRRFVIGAIASLLAASVAPALPVTFNAAADVPVTAAGFTATDQELTVTLNFVPVPGTSLMVVKNTGSGPITGTFTNVDQGASVALTYAGNTYPFIATYFGGTGNDMVLLWPGTTAYAWGHNFYGQVGDGTAGNASAPVAVLRPGVFSESTLTAVTGGSFHTLSLTADGKIYSWGYNEYSQLGDGSVNNRAEPDMAFMGGVLAGKTVTVLANGSLHSLALASDGKAFAWGYNGSGQLGDGTAFDRSVPGAVDASGVLAGKILIGLAGGDDYSLALADDGKVYAWGGNGFGQLGDGISTDSPVPVAVDMTGVLAGKTVVAIGAGHSHSLALTSDGKIYAWGNNQNGQLGNGTGVSSAVPVAVSMTGALAGKIVKAIAAGGDHNVALTSDGHVYAWGRNDYGQLGDPEADSTSTVPLAVDTTGALAGKTITAIAAGYTHSLALGSTGQLFAWGNNSSGQLGDGTGISRPSPVAVDQSGALAGKTITSISTGGDHTLVLAAAPQAPDIAVDQPVGNVLIDGTSVVDFGTAPAGTSTSRTFTLRNTGSADLTGFTITKTGPHAAEFTITAPSLTALTANAGTTFSIEFTAAGSGIRSAVIHIASNDPDEAPFDIGLTGVGLSESEVWRQTHFGSPMNTGDGSDNADPDHDGITNLVEFATNQNPNGVSQPPATLTRNGTSLEYSYTCNKAAVNDGIAFVAEWTDNLAAGPWSTNGVTTTIVDHFTTETVTATIPAGTSGHRFVRLRVTRL